MKHKLTKLALNSALLSLLLVIVAIPAGTAMLIKYQKLPSMPAQSTNQVLSTQDVRETTESTKILEEADK